MFLNGDKKMPLQKSDSNHSRGPKPLANPAKLIQLKPDVDTKCRYRCQLARYKIKRLLLCTSITNNIDQSKVPKLQVVKRLGDYSGEGLVCFVLLLFFTLLLSATETRHRAVLTFLWNSTATTTQCSPKTDLHCENLFFIPILIILLLCYDKSLSEKKV